MPDIKLQETINKGVNNLIDSPTENIGNVVGELIYLVFGGITHKANLMRITKQVCAEEYLCRIKQNIKKIPTEDLINPNLYLVTKALDDSKYCLDRTDLQNMFSQLIAACANRKLSDYVHPSFSSIIKELSPTDAFLLSRIRPRNRYPVISVLLQSKCVGFYYEAEYNDFFTKFGTEETSASLTFLQSLGLITISYKSTVGDSELYKLCNNKKVTDGVKEILREEIPTVHEVLDYDLKAKLKPGYMSLTNYGIKFVDTCLYDSD